MLVVSMPRNSDTRSFQNADLLLHVSASVSRSTWDESRYDDFLSALCEDREYQRSAILTTLRYLLGERYSSLRDLAKENYDSNEVLQERYGSWENMQRHLQLPDQLSASLDLATGTGKSYVLYGIAAILLAEGAVDRVLVLCPSTTIETGLLTKFRELAADPDLRDLLPASAHIGTPAIINARETIVEGAICVENYHAVLEHVGSSVRDSLEGKGWRTAVLNDEAHHIVNDSVARAKKWKDFLLDPAYGFRYVIGVSGTCYVGDDYFADVIFRYSLREAMEQRYVKKVDYVSDMPQTSDYDEKWQLILAHHEDTKRRLRPRRLLPLTIVVTPSISRCNDVADELRGFLIDRGNLSLEQAEERVLVIHSNAADLARLSAVDSAASKVEWIVSVSMLNEGWDVKRVFQIVPHEERAFNSKLLISQVLGRGLRIPEGWTGTQPTVTVFNHDAWAGRIRHLVNEVLDVEKRITTEVVNGHPLHFTLHNIHYRLDAVSSKKPVSKTYELLAKDYVDLAAGVPVESVDVEFERAASGERHKWQAKIHHRTYSAAEVAAEMFARLQEAEDAADPDAWPPGTYTLKFPLHRLEKIVAASLERVRMTVATESTKQKFLQALGPLRRKSSQTVRYTPVATDLYEINTSTRPAASVSAGDLRRDRTLFFTPETRALLRDEQQEFFDEVADPGALFRRIELPNDRDFKTPCNAVIADADPEKRFIAQLVAPANTHSLDAWLKSTPIRFYEIDYAWKKGEHPKRGKFSPDFFIKVGQLISVVEIKGDEELRDPSEENRKKAEYATAHFERLNQLLAARGVATQYCFNFLTPKNFGAYFQYLREGNLPSYRSELDVRLAARGD
jgi:type III restriction enzyme